jgi:PleD family two-component response regulator
MGESDLNSKGPNALSVRSSSGDNFNPGDKMKIAAATTPMLPGQAPVNILIVDDEPKNLTVLEAILDDPGYRLVRAESAEQALLALLADEFALLILDIRMPGVTGTCRPNVVRGGRTSSNRFPMRASIS